MEQCFVCGSFGLKNSLPMVMNKKIAVVIFIFMAIFLEFFRDYLFVNLNLQIQFIDHIKNGYNAINYTDSTIFKITKDFSTINLKLIKCILTLFFFIFFIFIGSICSVTIWEKKIAKKFIKLYIFSGVIIFGSGFIIYLCSLFLNTENSFNFYYISIELSHFVQSSLYPITFLLIFYAFRKMKIQPKY